MEFTGSQQVHAPQAQVFQAILNPVILKESVPGCTAAEITEVPWASGKHIKLDVKANLPGMSGSYTIYVKPEEVVEPSHILLVANPSSSLGSLLAHCSIDLVAEEAQTVVNYTTTATLEGKLASLPEFVIKPAVKSAIDGFFKNLEKHIN